MPDSIIINDQLSISAGEYAVTAVRSQGAGGQNVNKVSTAIQLRFDIALSSLPGPVKQKLLNLNDQRVSSEGVFVIKAQESRSQVQNLKLAKDRLAEFVRQGLIVRKKRIATKPSKAARQRRLESKRHRSHIKQSRGRVDRD